MGFHYSNLMQFDSLIFQQKILIDGFNGLGTVVLSLISENTRSRFMLELMLLLCRFWVLKRFARSQLLRLFNHGSDNSALTSISWFLLKIGSDRILDAIVSSGHWFGCSLRPGTPLNSPWRHMSFCGHRVSDIDPTYLGATSRLRRQLLGTCSRTNVWRFPTYFRRRIPAFLPFGIKASWVCTKTITIMFGFKISFTLRAISEGWSPMD